MNIYVIVLLTLHILLIGKSLGENNRKDIFEHIIALLIYLPVFGRILGWF